LSPATTIWLKRAALVLVLSGAALFMLPQFVRATLGVGITAAALLGYVAIFAGLPFLAWIVFGAFYKIFLKPYVRAWHINRIRNNRELREAASRD
jgi:ABC-type amino acid transport system permease subunit